VLRASVIIRTKNEERALGRTLELVSSQRVSPLEIIVIDSGSTDRTLEIARRAGVRTMSIPPAEWNYARAINRAATIARGEALVMLSAHCFPVDDGWLGSLVRHFDDPAVAAVWGAQHRSHRPMTPCGPPSRQLPGTYTSENWTWGYSNANGAVRACLQHAVPFDESFPAAEDKQWGRVMLDRGFVVVHEPAAAVWHDRHSVGMAFRRQRAVMEGFRLMFPEAGSERARLTGAANRAVVRTVLRHARDRDLSALAGDVKRAPTALAAIIGGLASRRPRRSTARRDGARHAEYERAIGLDEPLSHPEAPMPPPIPHDETTAEAPPP
jgi:Glycosyl transferase family 2